MVLTARDYSSEVWVGPRLQFRPGGGFMLLQWLLELNQWISLPLTYADLQIFLIIHKSCTRVLRQLSPIMFNWGVLFLENNVPQVSYLLPRAQNEHNA